MTKKQGLSDANALKLYLKNLSLNEDNTALRLKSSDNFFGFIKTYFSHHIDNINKETSIFRSYVHDNIDSLLSDNKELIFTAYRGAAKSTLLGKLLVLWLIAKQKKHYFVLITSSFDLGVDSLELIAVELGYNENFKNDYEIKVSKINQGELTLEVANGFLVKIKTFGAGKKIRGTSYLSYRPDMIILDDIENDENVSSKVQRDKLFNWYLKVVRFLPSNAKAGQTRANILIVGTILHYDSLICRLKDLGVSYQNFPLVLDFKSFKLDDSALDKKSVKDEYLQNKEGFLSERQNIPLSKDKSPFGKFKEAPIPSDAVLISLGVDPSLGKQTSDYFALSFIYKKDKQYYVKAIGYKKDPSFMIDEILRCFIRHRPLKIGIEVVAFQEFFKDMLQKKAKALGLVLPIVAIKQSASKDLRIVSLAPYINNHDLLIDPQSDLLIDELLSYPKAVHDDLLDATQMAFNIANMGMFDYKKVAKSLEKFDKETKILALVNGGMV